MSQLGLGVMISLLSYGSKDPVLYYGKKIASVEKGTDYKYSETRYRGTTDDAVKITFDDGKAIVIFDNGQSCCENRYITCDDDLQTLVGNTLTRIEAKDGPTEDCEYGDVHETMFVEIGTDQNFVTLTTHNAHNGYYGGFALNIQEVISESSS
jgi:hypothetical protein